MKEDPGKLKVREDDRKDIRSEDIPNAHASGDGAMGRNDEKIGDDDAGAADKSDKDKNRSAY